VPLLVFFPTALFDTCDELAQVVDLGLHMVAIDREGFIAAVDLASQYSHSGLPSGSFLE
jgi:hypothetical protein